MSQILQMQNQLMQGFLISENRLKTKREELNQEVETQVSAAQEQLVKKQRLAEAKKDQKIKTIQSESKRVVTSLEQYQDFVNSVQRQMQNLTTFQPKQDPNTLIDITQKKLIRLQRDIQSKNLINFDAICKSVSQLVEPTFPLQKEIKTHRQNYIQQKALAEQEMARQNEEFVLSVLLMIVSGALIIGAIWFIG